MTSSRRGRLLLGALLLLSLGAKVAANRELPEPSALPELMRAKAAFARSGFTTSVEHRERIPRFLVTGVRRDCRIAIGDYPPFGGMAAAYDQLARDYGSLRFTYRGALYDRAPRFWPVAEYFAARELRRIGVPSGRATMLAIASTPACPRGGLTPAASRSAPARS